MIEKVNYRNLTNKLPFGKIVGTDRARGRGDNSGLRFVILFGFSTSHTKLIKRTRAIFTVNKVFNLKTERERFS